MTIIRGLHSCSNYYIIENVHDHISLLPWESKADSPTPTAAGSELRDDSTSRLSNSKHSLSIPIDV